MKNAPQKLMAEYVARIKLWLRDQNHVFTTLELQDEFGLTGNNIIVVRRWMNRWEKAGLISRVARNDDGHVIWMSHHEKKRPEEKMVEELGALLFVNLQAKGFEQISMNKCIETVRGLI